MSRETRHRINPTILQRARELRQPLTAAERTLWRRIRDRQLGYKYRRQHPIENFIVDFYCAEARLCIEIDGPTHLDPAQEEYDQAHTEILESLGYNVIRFTNEDVQFNANEVTERILLTTKSLLSSHTPSP
jgi:very-short-patch-repair endonuclease